MIFCTVILNNYKYDQRFEGFIKLHMFSIRDKLNYGNNEIRFQVENANFEKSKPPDDLFWNYPEKPKANPYGLRYRIAIKYRK